MSNTTLNTFFASAPVNNHEWWPVQFESSAWADPIRLVRSVYLEPESFTIDSVATEFQPSGLAIKRPDVTSSGNQTIAIQLDGVSGEVLAAIDQADEAEAPITMTFWSFLESDRATAVLGPVVMTLSNSVISDTTVSSNATFHDYHNQRADEIFTVDNAPGVGYF